MLERIEEELLMELLGQRSLDLRMPWGGRDPRVLTKSRLNVRFAPEGMGRLDLEASHVGDEQYRDSDQLALFLCVGG